jgi:UDP-N-acetylmuramate dehydrogenase
MIAIEKDISLRPYNTFSVDCFAERLITINNVNEISELVDTDFLEGKSLILGAGSNILFRNEYKGTVIRNQLKGIKIGDFDTENVLITAGSGMLWHNFVEFCVSNNFYGLENLALIPGTVGAAPVQNIGAYGVEQKDCFHSLEAINLKTGAKKVLDFNDCKFEYRYSFFKEITDEKYLITNVTYRLSRNFTPNTNYKDLQNYFQLHQIKEVTARNVFDSICEIRRRKLPDPKEMGNGGSFFKNPEISVEKYNEIKNHYPDITGFLQNNGKVKLSAAWLIEKGGWKGTRIGDAGVYDKHALILVNFGNASGNEILEFAEKIRLSVYEMFNVQLEREVIVI